jgi:transketolase
MSTQAAIKRYLEHKAYLMRVNSVKMTSLAGSGHPTSALSAADLVSALFFYGMGYDEKNPHNPHNDHFILSKGHASPILYSAWKETGVLTDNDLQGYRTIGSVLEGHPSSRFDRVEAATGSLGMGLSIGAGMALYAKRFTQNYLTYVLLGDSELTEGSVWEAAEIAAYYKLNNLIALVDCNRLGQTTQTIHGHNLERYKAKFEAFGWNAIPIDGHDMHQIMHALDQAQQEHDKPTIIIAKTIKGYGVADVENKQGFHGKAFKQEDLPAILDELCHRFMSAVKPTKESEPGGRYAWWKKKYGATKEKERIDSGCVGIKVKQNSYKLGEKLATRKAYGQSLVAAGHACPYIVSLDGEVKNSTYAELFEEAFPDQFVQCFIAEQNMVSMGVGMQARGAVPFISTFGAFFSRAYDQLRMAAIGNSPLRLVGSHAGVSIGQDGPSQMGLEDIAIMRALPGSVVLYPCDAISTQALVAIMVAYNQGITYLRTTRMATPVIYDPVSEFRIGGCHVLKQSSNDQACIIAAGITLFNVLKAYDILQQQGIAVSVIDMYSIKPLDRETILSVAQESHNRIITVEDHYLEGGLGQAVVYALRNEGVQIECLAVTRVPRSGAPEELFSFVGIDVKSIIIAVKG